MKSIPCHRNNCDWPIKEKQQIYNFTLIAKHVLGERSINSIVNLKQRVLLLAPSSLTASYVNASDISLIWSLRANYTSLRIHCQVQVQENQVNLMTAGKLPTDIYQVDLSGLHPHTRYDLGVRCMAESSLAGWSSWTHLPVWTREDEPTGVLDVWRHIDDEDGEGRHVTLYWRPSSLFRANGLSLTIIYISGHWRAPLCIEKSESQV
ncbi:hypothetical protein GDO81_002846 [Engystomops pustulosus]|uniref:Fibronectin type-III domain-containing protein n=1 Tax=Engystomops pustulosus TaxID=76066 RepID=A0AAV7DNA3_ENGPU|nr:hypothetical protein GDO81_002846 [Engystomops pustulosus]